MVRTGKPNAVTVVRWFFALSLVCFHACVLTGHGFFFPVKGHAIVSVFFVLSGMLSYEGFVARPNARRFYLRRFRKIYPPYAFVIIACVMAGAFLSTLSAADYIASTDTWKYLLANLSFLNFLAPTLPGVFAGHAVEAVNSSLWTMKVEVLFYAILPAVVWLCRRFRPMRVIGVIYIASAAWLIAFAWLHVHTGKESYEILIRQLPGQMMYFAAGIAATRFRNMLLRHKYISLAAGVIVWGVCSAYYPLRPIEPIFIATTITVIAFGFSNLSNISTKIPNLTYEIYLIHFPILQTMISVGLFASFSFATAFSISLATILIFAVLFHKILKLTRKG